MRTVLITAFLLYGTCVPAYGEAIGASWLTEKELTERLKGEGYTQVQNLKAENGHWKGEAVKDGKTYEINADAQSGAITKSDVKR